MNPLISIVIPAYQCERTLTKCVNSILSQTYGNREILIINDGSTDGTRRIAEEFAAGHPDVRVINKPHNEGLVAARKTSLQHVKGEFIFFNDADDYLYPDAIQKVVEALEEDTNMVVGNQHIETDKGTHLWDTHNYFKYPPTTREALYANLLSKSIMGYWNARLVRTDLAWSVLNEPEYFKVGEDVVANILMVSEHDVRIKLIDDCVHHYVQYPVTMVNRHGIASITDRQKYIQWVLDFFLKDEFLSSPLISSALCEFASGEYFSYLRDGGGKWFDPVFHEFVCSNFIKWKVIKHYPLWRIIILLTHKYCPPVGYIISSSFAWIRRLLRRIF